MGAGRVHTFPWEGETIDFYGRLGADGDRRMEIKLWRDGVEGERGLESGHLGTLCSANFLG